jgi:hypothetical protein
MNWQMGRLDRRLGCCFGCRSARGEMEVGRCVAFGQLGVCVIIDYATGVQLMLFISTDWLLLLSSVTRFLW